MSHLPEIADLHVIVHGRVQGVGFRYAVVSYAVAHEIQGWVRNRSEGSVEVAARGEPESIAALLSWLQVGPPGARVESIEVLPTETDALTAGFQVRY
ncbi:MAG: acylphosphatase [Acidimicrobiia bacterium]